MNPVLKEQRPLLRYPACSVALVSNAAAISWLLIPWTIAISSMVETSSAGNSQLTAELVCMMERKRVGNERNFRCLGQGKIQRLYGGHAPPVVGGRPVLVGMLAVVKLEHGEGSFACLMCSWLHGR